MKRQTEQDERILMQNRKVFSEAYSILMLVLLVSMLVQQFLFDAPFEQYAVEFICCLGISVYIFIRKLTLGVNIFGETEREKRVPLVNVIVCGITITIVNGILAYESYEENLGGFIISLLITFVCATVGAFIAFSFLNYFNKRKQISIQKGLDEEEDE